MSEGAEILVEFEGTRGFINLVWPQSLRLGAPVGDAEDAACAVINQAISSQHALEDSCVGYAGDNWLRYYGTLADMDRVVTHLRGLGYEVRVADDPRRVLGLAEVEALAVQVARGEDLDVCEQAALAATALALLRAVKDVG